MNHTKNTIVTIFLLTCLLITQSCSAGTTYYIDSIDGNDLNHGTSEQDPWKSLEKVNATTFKPGDKILLKARCIWQGQQLWPKGSGTEGKPIIIDMYGDLSGPRGSHQSTTGKPRLDGQGEVTDVVKLYNQQYWEIKNLEITNFRQTDNSYDVNNLKRGVYIGAEDIGPVKHIYLENLSLNNINSALGPGHFPTINNGGIFVEVKGKEKQTWYEDLLIQGCHIYDVDRTGIANISTWRNRTVDDDTGWVPSKNIVIRDNVLERIGGNGMIIRVAKSPLVEYNVFNTCGRQISGNAMFFSFCDDALGQYNEAYNQIFEPGETDASGFDIDVKNKRTLFQYNYSHDNGLGAFVICTGTSDRKKDFQKDGVIRYNICQNNSRKTFYITGHCEDSLIYNNTIFFGPQIKNNKLVHLREKKGGGPTGTKFFNNIFYALGKGCYYDLEGGGTSTVFSHNVFFGQHPDSEPNDPFKLTSDPKLIAPGTGKIGRDTVGGYMLKEGSPCIDSGKVIENNGGKDYFGNTLYNGKPDRGAHEFQ